MSAPPRGVSMTMLGMILLAAGVIAILLTAAAGKPAAHMIVAALLASSFVVFGVRTRDALESAGASRSALESVSARAMGLVWLWGGLGLFGTYLFFLSWREWWHFTLAFLLAGTLCLGFAATLDRDARAGKDDQTLLKLGRYLGIAQLAGMIITVAGLAIDPDKEFLATVRPDWAANSIFLFGALALAAITAHALMRNARQSQSAEPSSHAGRD